MPLTTRTVNISLLFATPKTQTTVRFLPDLTAADGQTLLEKVYTALVPDSALTAPGSTTLTGSINLPVQATGAIPYRVEFPEFGGKDAYYIELVSGGAIDLSTLMEATLPTVMPSE